MLERIVVIHDNIEPGGGATGLARLAATEYRKLGYAVTYITGSIDDGSLDEFGIEVVALGQKSLLAADKITALTKGFHNREAAQLIAGWIDANDTPGTAYHVHNWSQILSPSVFKPLRKVEARVVVSCHDFFNSCPNGGLLHFPKGEVCNLRPMSAACWMSQCDRRSTLHKYWRMGRHLNLNRLVDFKQSKMTFVCLHKGMEDVMRNAGFEPARLTSVPNPAIPYTSERVPAEQNADFIFVGRINREKGADIVAEAARLAGVRIVMMGEGELVAPLSAAYPNAVFPGFCNKSQIEGFARSARALVVPGRWREPFGLVIAEAALSGLPVILSEPSTLARQIEDLDMGRVFDPASVQALGDIMTSFASDDELVHRLSLNAFSRANQICSTPAYWAEQFVDLLAQGTAIPA